mgnify:CR=1 FL=1
MNNVINLADNIRENRERRTTEIKMNSNKSIKTPAKVSKEGGNHPLV